ncbi:hypothetical protein AB1Y20_017267 [Prymnesium parvum]|uniref:Uncharacterized protein n=1 Tax=Prymnesium parvum TaxID=97485 RepID=A0AB34JKR4_PRYPA
MAALLLAAVALPRDSPSLATLARSLTDAELDAAIAALHRERHSRASQGFRFVHKKTYATSEPIAAALFLQAYLGAKADTSPFQHHCADTSLEQPQTKNAYFAPSAEQPHGFAVHFVRNPHKPPQAAFANASVLGEMVERWRGDFGKADRFDQFMDNHIGLVFDSLDPLIDLWRRDGIPFVCRTWYCGPGMPQWEKGQCPGNKTNTEFGETGCYIEVPHGIIVEALCPLGDYNRSRACLTRVDPGIFDLCTST